MQEWCENDDPEANLVTSLIEREWHAPVIDLDFPCELVPSATEGHFHLYINKPVEWDKYVMVLKAMLAADLLDKGWVQCAIAQKFTAVREKDVLKFEIEPYKASLQSLVRDLEQA